MLDDKDLPRLMTFSTGQESFYEMASVSLSGIIVSDDWFDLPELTTFITGYQSFYETTSLSLNSMMIDDWLIWSS